jgi:hypothetical protein
MRSQLRLEHIVSFADAIFAFSITFMAITIDIPNLERAVKKPNWYIDLELLLTKLEHRLFVAVLLQTRVLLTTVAPRVLLLRIGILLI